MLMSEWAEFLGDVTPGQVQYALRNLPEFPPNSSQFKELCWKAPIIDPTPKLAISPPQDMGDGPEAMMRRQKAYENFKKTIGELWKTNRHGLS